MHICVCVCVFHLFIIFVFTLHGALLKALVYMILLLNHNAMYVVTVAMFYLVIISDTTDEFLPGDDKDILN